MYTIVIIDETNKLYPFAVVRFSGKGDMHTEGMFTVETDRELIRGIEDRMKLAWPCRGRLLASATAVSPSELARQWTHNACETLGLAGKVLERQHNYPHAPTRTDRVLSRHRQCACT